MTRRYDAPPRLDNFSNSLRCSEVRFTTYGLRIDMLSIPWAVIRHRPLGLFPDTHVHRGHDTPFWNNNLMATAPDSTKTSLRQRIQARARERWPQLNDIHIRHQGAFAYVAGEPHRRTTLPLFRLRYNGSSTTWGFAIYRASHEDYEPSVLPSGYPIGTPQEALDCACGLYLNDPTAWQPPTN